MKILKNLKPAIFVFICVMACNSSSAQRLLIEDKAFTPESQLIPINNASSCYGFLYPGDTARFNDAGKITYFGTGSRITKCTYNPQGLLETEDEKTTYNSDGSYDSYEYDVYGNITKHYRYLSYAWESHYGTEIDEFIYNDSLLVWSRKYFTDLSYNSGEIGASTDTTEISYDYDSQKRLTKETEKHSRYVGDNKSYEYTYDEKGRLVSINTLNLKDNSAIKTTVYVYDMDGNIVSREITSDNTYTETYKYKNGKLIEKKFKEYVYLSDDYITYKYDYDSYGNVLTVKQYSENGKNFMKDIINRRYVYIKY